MAAPTQNAARVLHPQYVSCRELCICDETQTDQSAAKFGWGVTPVAASSRQAMTQTYSTADATIPALTYADPTALTAAALTVTDGAGTNDGTIGAITDNATTIAAVQELAAQINKIIVDITSIRTKLVALGADALADKKNLNAVVDALQAVGLLT